MTILLGYLIPLTYITGANPVILQRITETMGFDKDGNPTGTYVGYTIHCVETRNFKPLKVKIPLITLPITSDDLQEAKEADKYIFIKFKDGFIKPYYSSSTKTVEDSIIAQGFEVVKSSL